MKFYQKVILISISLKNKIKLQILKKKLNEGICNQLKKYRTKHRIKKKLKLQRNEKNRKLNKLKLDEKKYKLDNLQYLNQKRNLHLKKNRQIKYNDRL